METKRSFSLRLAVILFSSLIITACGCTNKSGGIDVKKEIDSDGGTITAGDGLTVTIPAGAIDGGPITIEIKSTGTPVGDFSVLSTAYQFLPAGTVFNVPVQVSVPFTSSTGIIKLFWSIIGDDNVFDTIGGTVSGNNYQANVIHFSTGFVGSQTNQSDGGTMNCIPGAGYCIDPTTGYWWQNPPFDGTKPWKEAVAYCPTLNVGGQTGWHLPTISQLRSLIRNCPETQTGGSCGVTDSCSSFTCYNPECLWIHCPYSACHWDSNLQGTCFIYWSSSSYGNVWSVSFIDATVKDTYPSESEGIKVRCVRTGAGQDGGMDAGSDAGTDAGYDAGMDAGTDAGTMNCDAGYCIDPTTGYWWQNPPFDGQKDWDGGVAYCSTLNVGGQTGWTLPTISQLRSLIRGCPATQTDGGCGVTDSCLDGGCVSADCDGCGDKDGGCYWDSNLQGTCDYYWSSSPQIDEAEYEWDVFFKTAMIISSYEPSNLNVRCVRVVP